MFELKKPSQWHLIAIVVTAILALGLYMSHSVRSQGKTKRTISLMHYYPEGGTPPVKIHNLKVRGKGVNFSSMYEEGNKRLEKKGDSRSGVGRRG